MLATGAIVLIVVTRQLLVMGVFVRDWRMLVMGWTVVVMVGMRMLLVRRNFCVRMTAATGSLGPRK